MKRIILIIILAAVVYVAMNFDFFRKNIEYKIKKETGQSVEIPNPREKMQPNQLLIPALSIETPVLYAERVDEDHFQELLIEGVVHYPGTAKIGEPGNMYIFGHSSDNVWAKGNYKTVFALLPKIKKGDKIIVSDHLGNKFVYEARETKVVAPDDLSVLDQGQGGKKLLTLQTSYPVGTALKRFVVIAELIK
ncbi:MAG: hypothetical protein A3C85_01755 [Candidatus Doudnabacteria bacterium RIFCSPHIGHO2_02_FULL_48_21]|uniref:Sortase n=1 Tax=Candidatus Doudnabacteria bacterium RIFCSPLOWO2_02_FULL_48_13 TaxID=1817845 RepID=A0A1F5QD31_9BACT|nr:MAG: hypothetical protein A3K05_02720 [Candidatus Doudnabacteria bacterium RIFCSPHIGHO2_01_48_18]OGE77456.1 MAG: hypothetical protein A2668_04200 [Candidatus Doudnabacteria bacterium RIFCSPHIGHO2_01_FULL_48_180]OGE91565.1 MAG: hypothetical protein A3F44_04040 [Candidatus Doudnabacteria bacterium RIFCSPHIGHO2_12_FULL_47_25]OGE93155.1 MAG: hypothetical protein A3C85_01755 [Candidatus Doudnabacteria bacterium RIFCSPHIGHO2_02_FULL_48_21]OGE97247.1 MAG: hypothetical protein A3A83_01385 [Candidatu